MKKFLVLLLISLSSLKVVCQVAILNEPFTTANATLQTLPSGWTRDASLDWVSDDGSSLIPSCGLVGASGGTLVLSQNNTSGFLYIQSKLFSSAGYSNITMQWNQYNTYSAPNMTVEWSSDNVSWTTITAFTNSPITDAWYNATATLQATAAQNPTLYVRFSYIADGSGLSYIGLDDVKVLGDASPATYYWNGGNTFASPAAGGAGSWGTFSAWRIASPIGSQVSWLDNNYAVFSGTAGIVNISASRTAFGYSFNTTSYTLQTTTTASVALNGPISLYNNVELVLGPNFPSANSGIIGIGSVNGIGASSITIIANTTSTSSATKINLANANASINVPTNIVTTSGIGLAGYVATANGCVINGNITNNSTLRTIIGATTGNLLNVNGIISGSSGLQISDGANNGAGKINVNSNNTYAGSTIFNAASTATITLGTNDAFPITTNLTMGATNQFATQFGGIFDLNGFNQTIGNIGNPPTFTIGSGTITNNSSVSHSTLTITQNTVGSFNRPIKDGAISKIAITKNGTSTLTLNGAGSGYSFSGGLTINAGELRFNPSSSPINIASCPVTLNGGVLSSISISASSVLNYSTLTITDNSTISLSSTNAHTLNFAASNALSWTPSKILTIVGWQGTYSTSPGSSGTTARIFVGTGTTALTSSQLSQIKFYDGSTYYGAALLANGELVPGDVLTQLRTTYCGYTALSFGEFVGADSILTATDYQFQLVNTANSFTQTFTNSSGYPYLALYLISGISYNTTYTVSVRWSSNGGSTWSAYGPACTLTSPMNATTQLSTGSCGSSPANLSIILFADAVSGATQYRFKVENSSLTYTQVLTKNNNNFNLAQFTGLTNSNSYSVSVAVFIFGAWDVYGPICTVIVPTSPTTQLSPSSCGVTASSYTQLLFANFVAGATQYQYQLVNSALSYTQAFTKTNNNFILAQFNNLSNNTTYSVSVRAYVNGVWGNFATSCDVTTPSAPVTQLSVGSCGSSPSSYNTLLFADFVVGATQYQYQLVNSALSYTQTLTKSNNNFILSQFPSLANNTAYTVTVRPYVNGAFSNFGTGCLVTTPGSPTTQLAVGYCGIAASTFSQLINANVVGGATQYEYLLTNTSLGYSQSFAKFNQNFILSQFSGLNLSTTYSVQVRVLFNGVWGSYGPMCNVTTPGSFKPAHTSEATTTEEVEDILSTVGISKESLDVPNSLFEVTVYPNPSQNQFALSVLNYRQQEQISVKVVDAMGRLIEQRLLMPEQLKDLSLGNGYEAGMYFVIVSQTHVFKCIKLVKE